MDDAVAGLGDHPDRPLYPGLPALRALSGRLRPLARAPARRPTCTCSTIRSSLRSVVNTLVFLVVAINVKMMVALLLSGFFIQARTWIKWLSVLFILPWAVPSIPTILSIRFMLNPEWGIINSADLPADLRGRAELAQRSDPRAVDGDAGAHLEVAAVLDADPDRGAARDPRRSLRGGLGRRRHAVGRNSASSPGRRCGRSISPARSSR